MPRLNRLRRIWRELHWRDKAAVFVLIAIMALLVGIGLRAARQEFEAEKKRRDSFSYVAQAESLEKVKESLNSLLEFVQVEKSKLKESEDIVAQLRSEQEKLKPLVETDRKVIDAILDLQYQKSRTDVWKERGFGFLAGVVSSMIASLIVMRVFKKKAEPSPP